MPSNLGSSRIRARISRGSEVDLSVGGGISIGTYVCRKS